MIDDTAIDNIREQVFCEPDTNVVAVLDGASVANLFEMLDRHRPEHCCLFSGDLAPDHAMTAPYLVRLEREDEFTRWIIAEGWGSHWGIFAAVGAAADFRRVRKHFRTFLMVRSHQGKPLYFRFYDPRVFRVYLPTCNSEEMTYVYGPVRFYAMEADEGRMLVRSWKDEYTPRNEELRLSAAAV